MKKQLAAFFALLLCLTLTFTAFAGTSVNSSTGSSGYSGETTIPSFLFNKAEHGIGCGVCPVYTAPSKNAFRAANGKASVDTNSPLMIGGFEPNGWLLVRYNTNKGGVRVGYIPPSYVKNYSTWHKMNFSYVRRTAETTLYVTDNPLDNYDYFAYLDPGEDYYILAEYTYYGNWWYIECTVDGKQARGFISK